MYKVIMTIKMLVEGTVKWIVWGGQKWERGLGYCQNQIVIAMTADNPIVVDGVTGEGPV